MKLLIDMNLSPEWVPALAAHGVIAVHWSSIGAHNASDSEIFAYAEMHKYVILTHDLDFGALLAHSKASSPSVIQARVQNLAPASLVKTIAAALRQFDEQLRAGALITIMPDSMRARVLPL